MSIELKKCDCEKCNEKTYFFGWENCKWFIREVRNIYSSANSFFSKKRIESGIAFIILQWGMIYWLLKNVEKVTSSDLLIWASIECVICGYTLHKIQSEKTELTKKTTSTDEPQ